MSSLLDIFMTTTCLSLSIILYRSSAGKCKQLNKNRPPRGYILHNQVTHARLLPAEAANAFNYPTLTLLVSLNALESHGLDLAGGWVFGYAGLRGQLTGLRSQPYLMDNVEGVRRSIKEKLIKLLDCRGYPSKEHCLEDAWMLTMPSFMGFEGINPLTVYFCYKPGGKFWLTALEIHNTFGESHVHLLEIGVNEDSKVDNGFDHQWKFHREFHVSPFNDRSGFYKVSVKSPSHPPTCPDLMVDTPFIPPRPTVRVHLHNLSPDGCSIPSKELGPLKLTALLRPTSAIPLTTSNLIPALARAPLLLFLSLPRILYQAWILHYKKRLDIYIRPEPHPAAPIWGEMVAPELKGNLGSGQKHGGGVKWLPEGLLDRYARRSVERFLRRRVEESGISVNLVSADPTSPPKVFSAHPTGGDTKAENHLDIYYLSPRLFSILFLSPSAAHALLLGSKTEHIFFPSSIELFLSVFSVFADKPPHDSEPTPTRSRAQRLRIKPISPTLLERDGLPIPTEHTLDSDITVIGTMMNAIVIWMLLFLDDIERWVFIVVGARIVPGDEPWEKWERAAAIFQDNVTEERDPHRLGSIHRAS